MGRKRSRAWKYIHFCITSLISLIILNCATVKEIKQQREAREYLHGGQQLLAQKDYEGALRDYQKVLSLSSRRSQKAEALFNIGLIYAHFGYSKKNYESSQNSFIKLLNDYPESPRVEHARIWVGVLQEYKRMNQMAERLTMVERLTQIEKVSEKPERLEKTERLEMKPGESGVAWEYLLRGQKLLVRGDFEGSINENQKVLSIATHKPPEDEALFNLGLIYAHFGNPQKDFGKSLDFFKRLIKDYPKSPLTEQAEVWVEVLRENEELNRKIEKLKQVDIEVEERKREKAK